MAATSTGLLADVNDAARRGYYDYPPIWNFEYVQSLKSEYAEGEGAYASQRDKLKEKVKMMLNEITNPLVQLENIDILQRLGISYHFEEEIKTILDGIYSSNDFESSIWKDNLYAMALKFRLLRQHLYSVPQEIFIAFEDESGKFKQCLGNDVKGLLCLYEASFLLMPGQNILEEAREFATKHLQEYIKKNEGESYLSMLVRHALEVPLHWRVPRLEARWFIDLCRRNREIMNPTFLELSILDYNIVQSIHQEELKELSRWWRDIKLTEKMNFFRDRLVENTLWMVGMIHEPQHAYCRKMASKFLCLIILQDDIYDFYGKLEELELYTAAFESWDIKAVDRLPEYMKISFFHTYNFTNELAFNVLNEQGLHAIKYLKKGWADWTKSSLQELKWNSGTTPTFHEYLENAWPSIGVQVLLVHSLFALKNPITDDALELLEAGYPSMIRQSSLICRLTNSLATELFEKENGEGPKSIEIYMNETGASEDEARRYLSSLVNEAWKQINQDEATNSAFSRTFIELVNNLNRMTMWLYNGGDKFGAQNHCLKEYASSVFVKPISLEED